MPSLREFTKQQFADLLTADGNRIEQALDDLLRRFNAVRKGDRRRRWVPQKVVGGYMPAAPPIPPVAHPATEQGRTPWLYVDNVAASTVAPQPASFANLHRLKGYRNPRILNNAMPADRQLAWTVALSFGNPVIVTAVSVVLARDATYPNDWTWAVGTPAGYPAPPTLGTGVTDFFVELSVDNPFQPENRQLNEPEFHRLGQDLLDEQVNRDMPTTAAGGFTDFTPNHPTVLQGVCVQFRNRNVPIPRDSRVRFAMLLPHYVDGYVNGWKPAAGYVPWNRQVYSWSISYLESVEA